MRDITLHCIAGPLKGQIFDLQGGPVFTFGRYQKVTCSLAADPAASHLHFLIDISDHRVRIIDLGSTNGLIINEVHVGGKMGKPLTDFITLKDGDNILAGACLFRLSVQDNNVSGAPSVPASAGGRTAFAFADAPSEPITAGVTTVLDKEVIAEKIAAERRAEDTGEEIGTTVGTNLPEGILPDIEGFTILETIGGGGKGIVYRAIANDTGLYAAIKMMLFDRNKNKKKRSLEMFRREIQITKRLHHPHIIRYLADGISLGAPYLALEYVDGGNLEDLIRHAPGGRLDPAQAIPLFLQLLEAVGYMHDQSLVHRDIKPKNVLLDLRRGGSLAVKLSDMGLTSRASANTSDDFLPIVCEGGTPAYMPPEQLTDLTRALPQSDVFSAAATFYHMVTGAMLYDFTGREQNETILDGAIRPILELRPDLPSSIGKVITRALSYDPANRYDTAHEFLDDFNRSLL